MIFFWKLSIFFFVFFLMNFQNWVFSIVHKTDFFIFICYRFISFHFIVKCSNSTYRCFHNWSFNILIHSFYSNLFHEARLILFIKLIQFISINLFKFTLNKHNITMNCLIQFLNMISRHSIIFKISQILILK